MKNKIIVLITVFIVAIICFIANLYMNKISKVRLDQHIDMKVESTCESEKEFCSHLPIIKINTNNQISSLEEYLTIDATFELYYKEGKSNLISDKENIKSKVQMRYRGNSSLLFPKHQYLLKFVKDNNEDKLVSLLGMNEENKWILNGPYLDKTLIRNYLAYNITGKIMDSTPEVRFCEVFLDDNYQGVYILVESISKTLTGITNYKPNWSNKMSSYIIRLDRYDETNTMLNNFTKYTNKIVHGNAINVIYPSAEELNDEIVKYINDDLSKIEKTLYSYDYHNYEEYIDVDSFVDYMIINEFFRNSDAGTHSTYLYKDVRGKLHMGPVWDFNNAIDNYVEEIYSYKGFLFQSKSWYEMLMKDEKFTSRVIARYRELRKSYLSDEYIQKYIDDTVSFLKDSIDRNYSVWGYTLTDKDVTGMLKPDNRNYRSYEEALNQLKSYLTNRGNWLDENIETLKQYSHPSVNKQYEVK